MNAYGPDYFYKFRPVNDYLLKQITHDEVKFSPPAEFNDPFDCKPIFNLESSKREATKTFQYSLKKFSPEMSRKERREKGRTNAKPSNINNVRESIKDQYFDSIRHKVGVYCLSTAWNNILMWSHYSDNHRGVCLEYNAMDRFFCDAFEVIYSEDRPKVYGMQKVDQSDQLENALLTKSTLWKYEQEWRMIYYRKGPGIYKIPHDLLTKIIFGVSATAETIDRVLKAVDQRKIKPEICHAKLSETHFAICV
jgi:hypothetical protein